MKRTEQSRPLMDAGDDENEPSLSVSGIAYNMDSINNVNREEDSSAHQKKQPVNPLPKNPLKKNKYHDCKLGKFEDFSPKEKKKYYQENTYRSVNHGICIVIPFYNEPAYELETTLTSLYESYLFLCKKSPIVWKHRPFHVCIIQDGWYKADDTMKLYLKNMFPISIDVENNKKEEIKTSWWDHEECLNNEEKFGKAGSEPTTIIVEKNALQNPMTYFTSKYHDQKAKRYDNFII